MHYQLASNILKRKKKYIHINLFGYLYWDVNLYVQPPSETFSMNMQTWGSINTCMQMTTVLGKSVNPCNNHH